MTKTLLMVGAGFWLFGSKMINVVLFGVFLWMVLSCYPNTIKGDLLGEVSEFWGGAKKEKDPGSLDGVASSMGSIYQNYGSDPLERIMVVMCSVLVCSEFFVDKRDLVLQGMQYLLKILVW